MRDHYEALDFVRATSVEVNAGDPARPMRGANPWPPDRDSVVPGFDVTLQVCS